MPPDTATSAPPTGTLTALVAGRAAAARVLRQVLDFEDVAFVPASFELLPMLTVAENVALPLELGGRPPEEGWLDAVLRTLELDGRGGDRAGELSRGDQLRVALARALATRPAILVVDDLAGSLDSVTRHGAARTLRRLADELGQTVVLGTGDAAAVALADRVVGDAA